VFVTTSLAASAEAPRALPGLLSRLRAVVGGPPDPFATANRVAAAMAAAPPGLDVLSATHREALSDRLASHLVYAERAFSVVALVVGPGQQTVIHDHLTWCVVTVLCGGEQETLYRDHGDHLAPVGHSINLTGTVTAFAPPGDIHRVCNASDSTAISLHVYGVDLRRTGSSVRRTYQLPIREHTHNEEHP
jgi:predicted metal-dependent enzyme (double-stranded beta helix superfamily)